MRDFASVQKWSDPAGRLTPEARQFLRKNDGGRKIVASATAPINPTIGDLWLDTSAPELTVSATEPLTPSLNDIWVDIS